MFARGTARWICTVAAMSVALHTPADACLVHYRSLDWLVADSPLIVVGHIVDVETLPEDERAEAFWPGEEEQQKPTVATVRIASILKGTYHGDTVRVHSGPVRSCSVRAVYYTFRVGALKVFILPPYPIDGTPTLVHAGSMLPIERLPDVEAEIGRAQAYRSRFLRRLQHEEPDIHAEGLRLHELLRAQRGLYQYPEPLEGNGDTLTMEQGKEIDAAARRRADAIGPVSLPALEAALAFDWFSDDPYAWSRLGLGQRIVAELAKDRAKDSLALYRKRVTQILSDAGVEDEYIDPYVNAGANKHFGHVPLTFPFQAPNSMGGKKPGEHFTTIFLLQYHSYRRGEMFRTYGMRFDDLANLDPERLTVAIPAMFNGPDERLRTVAWRAIERTTGTQFIDMVRRSVMGDEPGAWRCLVSKKNNVETERRMSALVESGAASHSDRFWLRLAMGECFEPPCVDKAIALLGANEPVGGTRPTGRRKQFSDALRVYLDIAKRRDGDAPDSWSAAQYREWFQAQRERTDDE